MCVQISGTPSGTSLPLISFFANQLFEDNDTKEKQNDNFQESIVSPRAKGTKISSLEINDLFSSFKFDDEGKNSSASSMPTSPHHGSTFMSFMMTNMTSMEEQIINLTKMVEELLNNFKEKDAQIASLTAKLEKIAGKAPSDATIDLPKVQMEDESTSTAKAEDDTQLVINNSISAAKLKELIKKVVKD